MHKATSLSTVALTLLALTIAGCAGRPSLIHRKDALATVPMDLGVRSGAAPCESFAWGGVTQVVDQVLTVIEASSERLQLAAPGYGVLRRKSPVV